MMPQEIFDKAMAGVINQGDLSISDTGKCFYRNPRKPGHACGVGHLVDDETAFACDNIQEAGKTSAIGAISVNLIPADLVLHMDLLEHIQMANDNAGQSHTDPAPRPLRFLENMKHVAKIKGLEVKMTERDIERVLA